MFKDITPIDLRILSLYAQDYSSRFSIMQITGLLKINYSNAFKRVKRLVKEGILIEGKFGHANSVSFNFNSLKAVKIICFVEEIIGENFKNSTFPLLIDEALKVDPLCCVGLFGSRISGKAVSSSDWDIFIIVQDDKRKEMEKIMGRFPHISNIQLHVFSPEEFEESLLSAEETVVKHIVKNKQILHNPHPFYSLIKRWEMVKYAPSQRS